MEMHNRGGANGGASGMHDNVYSRQHEGPAFQEQFWPQPIMDASLAAIGQHAGVNGTAVGGPDGSSYYGFDSGVNRAQGPHFSTPQLSLGESTGEMGSPRSGEATGPQVKKRVSKACDHCRRRKIKCGSLNPVTKKCANCSKYSVECLFTRSKEGSEGRRKNGEYAAGEDLVVKFGMPMEYKVGVSGDLADDREISPSGGEGRAIIAANGRIEKVDRKVSIMMEKFSKLEFLVQKIVKNMGIGLETQNDPLDKPKVKKYTMTLLTIQKLIWLKHKVCPEESYWEFLSPIRELMTISLKWHICQMKTIIDFSSPMFKDGNYVLNPIPAKAQCKRLVENNQAALLVSSSAGFFGVDYYSALIDKFYDNSEPSLSCAELLLLNTCICCGASRMRQVRSNDLYHLRKDKHDPNREDLKKIENSTLLNAIYYYNKVIIGSGGAIEIQGLFLLSTYLQENVDTELAMTILSSAIRFGLENGYDKVDTKDDLSKDLILRRSLWWHCYNKDKKFALLTSRPPLIREEDSRLLCDESYYEFTKKILYRRFPQKRKEIDALQDLETTLDYAVKYSEFLPYFMSYSILKLGKIELKIIETCFSFQTIVNNSFDQVIEKLFAIRKDLLEWENSLHSSMRLDTYKRYISLLYLPNDVKNPDLSYEIICSRVTVCHIRLLHLKHLLCLFATSFLIDNSDEIKPTRHKTLQFQNMFEDEGLESCMQILKIFQTVDYDLHMYNDAFYCFVTAAFSLLLYAAKNIDVGENKRIPPIIDLLMKNHEIVVGTNEEFLVSDNVKWNIALFFYTFLLSKVVHCFNVRNPSAVNYNFTSDQYHPMFEKILRHMDTLKNDALDRLQSCMNSYPTLESFGDRQSPLTIQVSPLSSCLHNRLSGELLNHFRSKKHFKVSEKDLVDVEKLSLDEDKSLFPTNDSIYDSFTRFTSRNLDTDSQTQDSSNDGEGFTENISNEMNVLIDEFQDFFCQNALFFDRDLNIANAFRDKVLVPS